MNQQTIDMLTDMKLSAMAAEFAAQLKDSSFNDKFSGLYISHFPFRILSAYFYTYTARVELQIHRDIPLILFSLVLLQHFFPGKQFRF